MKFLDLLKLLSTYGPKLKEIWAEVQAILAAVKSISEKLAPASEAGTLSSTALTADEHAEIDLIAQQLGGETSQIDLSTLISLAGLFASGEGRKVASLLFDFIKSLIANKG